MSVPLVPWTPREIAAQIWCGYGRRLVGGMLPSFILLKNAAVLAARRER